MDSFQLPADYPPGIHQFVDADSAEYVVLRSPHARAVVSLHGAQLMSFLPDGGGEVIWTGGFTPGIGKDCWGGVPICWPWFMTGRGDKPRGPFHGVARFSTWKLLGSEVGDNGEAVVRLGLAGPARSAAGEEFSFDAELILRLSDSLSMELLTRNTGQTPLPLEHCFHSYFRVGDVTGITIHGLEGTEVQDNSLPDSPKSAQLIPVTLEGHAARVFRPFPEEVVLEDPLLGRTIRVRSHGAKQLVLWNSGPVRTEGGRTTGEPDWRTQLALEPLCGLEEEILVPPGGTASLEMRITVETSGVPAS